MSDTMTGAGWVRPGAGSTALRMGPATLAAEDAAMPVDAPLPSRRRRFDDAGMTTAEYAIGTLAACAFAGILFAVLTSPEVRGMLLGIVTRALSLQP